MAMMKTWNDQGFVMKCLKKNVDNATKNQNDKDIFENQAKKSGKKQNK